MQRAYIHLGHNRHPVKTSDYKCTCKKIDVLIDKHIERTSKAPLNKIVMEACRDLVGESLLCSKDDPPKLLLLDELELIFDCCKEFNSSKLETKSLCLGTCSCLGS